MKKYYTYMNKILYERNRLVGEKRSTNGVIKDYCLICHLVLHLIRVRKVDFEAAYRQFVGEVALRINFLVHSHNASSRRHGSAKVKSFLKLNGTM
jgi:hypothetical protein